MRKSRRLPLEALAPFLLEVPKVPARLDWHSVFGNDHPVEIEVGFGKGLFLVNSAQAHPEVNYFGIEVVRKLQLFTATRMAKRGLTNVRLATADARAFLRDFVPTASVQALHVYFPDPWWKKRHQKRRVFVPEFAVECERVLAEGGKLHIATDVEEYFEQMTQTVGDNTGLHALPPPAAKQPAHDGDYLTNFERKARALEIAVHRALWEKRQAASSERR